MEISGWPPLTIFTPDKEKWIDVAGFVKKDVYHGPTKFNHSVVIFGNLFNPLSGSFISEKRKRWSKKKHPSEIKVLSFAYPEMGRYFDEISRIANTEDAYNHSSLGSSLRKKYRESLRPIFQLLKKANRNSEDVVRIAVLRAGRTAAKLMGYKKPHYQEVEAKRLPFIDGSLGVGLAGRNVSRILSQKNLKKKTLEFEEVCGATMVTLSTFVIDLYTKEIKPKKIIMNAPIVVQQGAEILIKLCHALGFDLQINAGKLYFGLDDKWYIHTDRSQKEMALGDAGDLCQP